MQNPSPIVALMWLGQLREWFRPSSWGGARRGRGWLSLALITWNVDLNGQMRAVEVPEAPVPVDREAPWRVASFAKDAGVHRRMVFDVAFESNNTAWFAVSDGLYRYDGFHWRRFSATNGLPTSFIRTVSVTRDGSLWVGTDHGAGVFDGGKFDRRGTGEHLAGPNVRRIVETQDGSLWFCCDRWPDATVSGGLTQWRDGVFRTYRVADGLPSDHLLSLFEQSNGRLIALTQAGPAVREGERWVPLRDAGYPEHDHTWAMAETPGGLVYAQAFDATLMLRNGRWTGGLGPGLQDNSPFCVTRDGSVIKAVGGPGGSIRFHRWDGRSFVAASAQHADQGLQPLVVRQAPDGAVWAIGRGTILRWEYLPGMWEWRPDLPPPTLEDGRGGLWFSDTNRVVLLEDGALRRIPEMRGPLLEDRQGVLWSAAAKGLARWTHRQWEPIAPETCGIEALRAGVADASAGVWLQGMDASRASVLSGFGPAGWRRWSAADLQHHEVLSLAADSRAGAWAVLNDERTSKYEIVRLTADGLRRMPIAGETPRTHRPRACASQGHIYLHGYNGLWVSRLGDTLHFSKVEAGRGAVIPQGVAVRDAAAFILQEGVDGNAAILVEARGEWLQHSVAYGHGLRLGEDGWLMVADGSEIALWQVRQWTSPTYVSLPADATVQSMLRTRAGDFWLGTAMGVLHLKPGASPPETALSGADTLVEGSAGKFQARGIAAFASQSLARRYLFSWRLDQGSWSGYDDWPSGGIPTERLSPGDHVIEARARDGLGNEDPTPAVLAFKVRPVPIQERRWFLPGLAAILVMFAALSLALLSATRRLRLHAGNLEREVQSRTKELEQDLARRETMAKALRESESRLLASLEHTPTVAVQWYDREARVIYWNHASEIIYGWKAEEVMGKSLDQSILSAEAAAEFRQVLEEIIRSGKAYGPYEVRTQRRDSSEAWMLATIYAIPLQEGQTGFACMDVDITERKRNEKLQEELAQAQKMESVGRLAGGVAHDFNNMLQAILGNAALALEEAPPGSSLRESLEEIQHSARRSADLTRQLLAFARKQTIQPKVLDLNTTLEGMLKMLRRLIGEDVELVWMPASDLWPVKVDPSQIDQVLANLCVNARDAIAGNGKVTIQTSNLTLDDVSVSRHRDAVPGDYVVLSVRDTGHGMDARTRSHLFEPFFTTKPPGKGTGLGLATVFGIVKQNQGLIEVESEPGQGTTFKICLPRAKAEDRGSELEVAARIVGGTETLLFVEDEQQILKLGQRILVQQGYQVLAAATPQAALDIARTHPGPIHLLISDVVMPEMNGKVLLERLRHYRPGVKCLFMSGYTADVIAPHGVLEEGMEFLQKPFSLQAITSRIRQVLDA